MKYTQEQEKNMESEEMKKELNDAIQSADMQSLRRILRLMRDDNDINSDYFIMNFDNDLFKNRDIALVLVEFGYQVPKELYENDEEIILTAVNASGGYRNGFNLASDKLLNDKNFVKRMINQIVDYETLEEIADYIKYVSEGGLLPKEVVEDGEIERFVRNRIQMLEENERMEGYIEAEMELYRDSVKEDGFYGTFLDYLYEREDNVERWDRPMIREIIQYEEELNEQHKEQYEEQTEEQSEEISEEISETPSKLQQLASTKKELEQIVSELRENISSAQKLLDSYEKLLNEEKQSDSNCGQDYDDE